MSSAGEFISIRVPGRINLIGDHTDYTGGLVLPTVVDLYTTVTGSYDDTQEWRLESENFEPAVIPVRIERADRIEPEWARYPAGVLTELRSLGRHVRGFSGTVSTSLPVGGGLSSSAALEIAIARIALGPVIADDGREPDATISPPMSDVELALMCQRAEQSATGVPCGIMDQLSIAVGRPGYATLIDCSTLDITFVPIPDELVVEHRFISPRTLVGSEYAERVAQCARIESLIGPLRLATLEGIAPLGSGTLYRRARHVVTENQRVGAFVRSLLEGGFEEAGRLMTESHLSLADDYETSTPQMDEAVDAILREPGVLGARMTGGGFGGCIVALRRR